MEAARAAGAVLWCLTAAHAAFVGGTARPTDSVPLTLPKHICYTKGRILCKPATATCLFTYSCWCSQTLYTNHLSSLCSSPWCYQDAVMAAMLKISGARRARRHVCHVVDSEVVGSFPPLRGGRGGTGSGAWTTWGASSFSAWPGTVHVLPWHQRTNTT